MLRIIVMVVEQSTVAARIVDSGIDEEVEQIVSKIASSVNMPPASKFLNTRSLDKYGIRL
jgi:hypothetical protein